MTIAIDSRAAPAETKRSQLEIGELVVKKPTAAEAKQRILLAALRLYSQKGTKTTLAEVAEQAGLNEITLYRHYYSGPLWAAVLQMPEAQLTACYEKLERLAKAKPLPSLRTVVAACYENFETHPYALGLIYHAWGEKHTPEALEFLRIHWKKVFVPLHRYFERGIASGKFRSIDPMTAARTLWGSMIYEYLTQHWFDPNYNEQVSFELWRKHARNVTLLFEHLLLV